MASESGRRSLFGLRWVRAVDLWGFRRADGRWLRVAEWLEEWGHPRVSGAMVLPTIIFCSLTGYYRVATALGLSAVITQVIVEPLRSIVKRSRPYPNNAPTGRYQYSFPSGHVAAATSVFGLMAYLLWRNVGISIGMGALIATASWVVAISMARVYVGAHWVSDVVGGWLIGLVGLVLCILVLKL